MKICLTTFTTILTTSSFLLALGSTSSDGLHRHIRDHKGSGVRRLASRNEGNGTIGLRASEGSSDQTTGPRLEKRSFYGQGTFFQPGQGACGWTASSRDHIAALNADQYGNMGQRSQHCGRYVWIKNRQTGKTTRAQVQDACPGCNYGSLDLSPAAFDDLAPESQGVVQIEWDFA